MYAQETARFTGKLKEILEYELSIGNTICEAYTGNWPYPNITAILLKNPFSPPIYKGLTGITFRNINDPHYWKAEYHDTANNLLLICKFGEKPNFKKL
ncbi:MAG: hypothetical protein ACK5JF_00875 [Oscillospiraceae bacterium]